MICYANHTFSIQNVERKDFSHFAIVFVLRLEQSDTKKCLLQKTIELALKNKIIIKNINIL